MNLPEIPHYTFKELVGEGSCGFVYRCAYKDQEDRAVKILKALAINPGLINDCLTSLAKIPGHRGIDPIHEFNLLRSPYYYCLDLHGELNPSSGRWMPYTLEPHIGALPLEQSLDVIDQLIEVLAHLHKHNVVHVGLKPSNIFVIRKEDGGLQVRLTDFGQGFVGGLHYMEMGDVGFYASPEQLSTGDFSHGQGKRWDVYAFGVIAYRLLTGRFPRLDSQHQRYLREHQARLENPTSVFGTVLEQPGQYVEWIYQQHELHWPDQPRTEVEASRREIIEQCLEIDPENRLLDMREVWEECQAADHAITRAAEQRRAAELREAEQRRTNRWKRHATLLGVLLALMAGAGVIGYFQYRSLMNRYDESVAEIHQTQQKGTQALASTKQELSSALAQTRTQADRAKMTAQELAEEADAAREFLKLAQANSDRFFQLILETRDSDLPGYQAERQARLQVAKGYYARLLEAYGDHPEFLTQAARARHFLGEILREEGDLAAAREKLEEAEATYMRIRQEIPTEGSALLALAEVKKSLAAIAQDTGQDDAVVLKPLSEATAIWTALVEAKPEMPGWKILLAESRVQQLAHLPGGEEKDKFLEETIDLLVNLNEASPDNPQVAALLGRSFAVAGEEMMMRGKTDDAIEAYDQSVDLLGKAVRLNGAVTHYQYHLGVCLAAAGQLTGDTEKLKDAVVILERLSLMYPERPRYVTALAQIYGELAQGMRDSGDAAAAIELQRKAVEMLEKATAAAPAGRAAPSASARAALAREDVRLAELHGDAGKHEDSLKILEKAMGLLKKLLEEDPGNPAYLRQMALARGLGGFASQETGDTEKARELYGGAVRVWDELLGVNADNSEAAEAKQWAQRQLDALE